jgi:hypothetical protein
MKKNVKQSVTATRLEEIEAIQERIRRLGEQYAKDFTEPNAMDSVVQKDLRTAADSLDLLKGIYKSKAQRDG